MVSDTLRVEETVENRRFELWRGDERLGLLDIRPDGDGRVLAFTHTETDSRHRGQGFGAVLVRGALDAVRARDAAVLP